MPFETDHSLSTILSIDSTIDSTSSIEQNERPMKRHLAYLFFLGLLINTGTASADLLDGSRAGDSYGPALSVQSVQTQFGDSEINAGYATVSILKNRLQILLTGNLEDNFNHLTLFIDSVTGGQNIILPDTNNGGVNPATDSNLLFENYSGVGTSGSASGPGFTFDTGFAADYVMSCQYGDTGFNFNFLSVGNDSIAESSIDIFGGSTQGSNASVGASSIGVAFDNSNIAGVQAGTGAANAVNAQAVLTGIELFIPLTAIGNPVEGDTIRISAHVNNSNHDFLSNQTLGGLVVPQGNLGGDGAGNFTNDVSLINLNNFAGDQFFSVIIDLDDDSSFFVVPVAENKAIILDL